MVRVSAKVRRLVELRAGRRCEYCHAPQRSSNARFHIEHFLPRSRGGTDDLDNLNLSCITCNLAKGDAVVGVDPLDDGTSNLFNPRRHRWDDHFAWASDGVILQGKTAIGRATIAALRMNQPLQVEARPYWRLLGLFP
jgi:5-methylcytosine-specific restriction endonuclease McrA